jgi:glycosyltransferase involved in cell wall biosynthesis
MTSPVLSIIVPSYNHCQYLRERLTSIYAQACQDFELIILDDASSDCSVELIKELLEGRKYTLIVNSKNSGSPFRQWEKGLSLAMGKYVWIAESDDSCSLEFVSSILPYLESEHAALAFTKTESINDKGLRLISSYWPEQFNGSFFSKTQLISCYRFLHNFLCARNCIPNVSSVIFSMQDYRREAILAARHAARYRFVGDWIFWARLIHAYGKRNMIYVSRPLCFHRDHGNTTRVVLDREAEGQRMREYSKAIHQVLVLHGLLAAWSFLRALRGGWWNWTYDQYLSRYKPLFIQRLAGYPQYGFHLIGYWAYRILHLYRTYRRGYIFSGRNSG